MTLSLNCKDAGDPVCTHTMYGETEEELLQNANNHGIEVLTIRNNHGMKKLQRMASIFAS
jgi:Protein of unknown function (DUF1059)